ncbi:hypothetical protein ACOQFV_24075 [Nocardiopsis changdeensis]|uniref:Uncharacterized protein n=1 Tax=Nocardiopsis changdeensis TaxID=2831969 RepID=A0A975KU01_9ACTN|nr:MULTISPECIES: hypothetical protein [Nocardiopsis]QUX26527.1 hypothetical protein KGD84_33045 [Nocardiopsis changdeensis]QYX40646.1 hypothetical protein K1J57_32115 [Nocardiopsis sp. MT53]
MPTVPPVPAPYRCLWRCTGDGPAVDTAAPLILRWANRNHPGAVPHLDAPGRYRLSARSRVVVASHTGHEGTRGVQVSVLTDRGDDRWTTSLAVVETPTAGAWVQATVHRTPPAPGDQILPPQVLTDLMAALGAADGHTSLPGRLVLHRDPGSVAALADALTDPTRILPLVLGCSPAPAQPGPRPLPAGLVPTLAGMAAVHVLDVAAQQEVTPLLPSHVRLRPGRLFVLGPPPALAVAEYDPTDPRTPDLARAAVTGHAHRASPPEPVAEVLAELEHHTTQLDTDPHTTTLVYTTASSPTDQKPAGANDVIDEARERARLADQVERLRTEVTRLTALAATATARAEELDQDNTDLATERDRQTDRADRAEAEAAWLRAQAAEHGLHQLAAAPAPPPPPSSGPPRRVQDLLERITSGELPHLVFTLDEGPVHDLALDRAKEALWVGRAWQAMEALEDWCRYQQDHPEAGVGFHLYLTQAPTGYRIIPPRRLGTTESEAVRSNERLAAQRVFTVPTDLDPTGKAPMFAHIKLDVDYGICPRIHFLPHPEGPTPTVVVGYLGRHLPVISTN